MAEGIILGDNKTEEEKDRPKAPSLTVHHAFKFDPDKELDKLSQLIDTKIIHVDAKLFEGAARDHGWKSSNRVHYRNASAFLGSPQVKRRIREAFGANQIKDLSQRLRENFKEDFIDYPDEQKGSDSGRVFRMNDQSSLPTFMGPSSRQMQLTDILDSGRKCFEAAHRNPIGKRITKIIGQFVLSRGVRGTHVEEDYLDAWMDFHNRNGMRLRIKDILKELVIFGEIFLRYFKTKEGLVIRSLDPMSIYEIVTQQDDIEDVLYYHQQYVTPTQMLMAFPAGAKIPASALIIRQIPAADIDHFKINATSFEKRGRSELYAILSWLIRFREFANDRVVMQKMRSMFSLDIKVQGGDEEVRRANEQFGTPPGTGSVLVHNANVEVEYKNANSTANEAKTDAEMILKVIAVGAGVSEQFLGVSYQSSRAGALIQTEPDVKNFEDYREIVEEILLKASRRVFKAEGLADPESDMEFTFPGIASEDRSAKVKDIALAESMDWFSKERAATMTAREFDVSNFDFTQEQETIRQERKDDPVIAASQQQVPKTMDAQTAATMATATAVGGAVGDNANPQPKGIPGRPGPKPAAKGSGKPSAVHPGAQGGFPSDLGGRGLARTVASHVRSKFTRGTEKKAIKNNRTSQTPRIGENESVVGRGWTDNARKASLMERKRRKAERLMREAKEVAESLVTKPSESGGFDE